METDWVELGSKRIEVWPEGQKFKAPDEHGTVLRTAFDDIESYHPRLTAQILELAWDPQYANQYARSLGGTKLYHLDQWESPEARLLTARAIAFFKHAIGTGEAVVDLSWANVYCNGDYCVPHSHVRSTASVVYWLEDGDPDPGDPDSGRFAIVDPRYVRCCQIEENRMTNPLMPVISAGSMLIFPSELVHCVNPYSGRKPRISISWNINTQAVPGSPLDFLPKAGEVGLG